MSRPPSLWKDVVDAHRGTGKFRTSVLHPGNGSGYVAEGVGLLRSRNPTCRAASALRVHELRRG